MPFKGEKLLALAKGFRGRAKNVVSIARSRVEKSLVHAYRGRKEKKRTFRALWIQRINAGTREHGVGPIVWIGTCYLHVCLIIILISKSCYIMCTQLPYSQLVNGLEKANIQLNRKVLSELAMSEPFSFKAIVDQVKMMRGLA